MKSTVIEASNYPIPEDTLVPVKLEAVEQVEIPFVHKKGSRMGQEKFAAGTPRQSGRSLAVRAPSPEFTRDEGSHDGHVLHGHSA